MAKKKNDKRRRHSAARFDDQLLERRAATWKAGISDADIARCLADIITSFEHIESYMAHLLSRLLGSPNLEATRFIYRTLKSPASRLLLLRALLEEAPTNAHLEEEFDELLDAYDEIRKKRNEFVHGLWWSDADGVTYLARSDKSAVPILDAKEVSIARLRDFIAVQSDFTNRLLLKLFPC